MGMPGLPVGFWTPTPVIPVNNDHIIITTLFCSLTYCQHGFYLEMYLEIFKGKNVNENVSLVFWHPIQ